MKLNFNYILIFFVCCCTLVSCVEEQDFGQVDGLQVTPTLEASILYIEAPEPLINASDSVDVISRNFNFDAFSSDVFAKRVLDGTITYIVENTTSKPMNILIELLNADNEPIDFENITTTPGMNSQTDVTYGSSGKDINIIKFTSSIRITAMNQGDSTSTSDTPNPRIILKSSGKFRLNIK